MQVLIILNINLAKARELLVRSQRINAAFLLCPSFSSTSAFLCLVALCFLLFFFSLHSFSFPFFLLISQALCFFVRFNKQLLVQGQGNKRQPTAVTAPKLVPRGLPQAFHNDCTVETESLESSLHHSCSSHLLFLSFPPLW